MKTLTKIISAALVLATAASASNLNFNNLTKNLTLYNELDLGTRTATLKLGMQHYFTNHVSAGAEISRRWQFDDKYDNTNNILFNVSYTF